MKEIKLLSEWADSIIGKFGKTIVNEGGNVFKAPSWSKENNEMRTDRISKNEVPMTTKFLEKLTGLPLKDNLLGSTGIADSSGDMDIAIDMNEVSKDDLVAHLTKQGVLPDDIRKTGDSVHYCSPIYGPEGKTDRLVQVDFMFVPSVEFARWSMRTAPDSTYKGKYLQQLRADLVNTMAPKDDLGKSQWKWNHFSGVLKRSDNTPVFRAFDPDDIAKGLLGKQATRADLESVERVIKALKSHEKRGDVVNTYRQTLARSPKEPQLPPDEELNEGFDPSNPTPEKLPKDAFAKHGYGKKPTRPPSKDERASLLKLRNEFAAKSKQK